MSGMENKSRDENALEVGRSLNEAWEKSILDSGADFVRFVDITSLSQEAFSAYPRAVIFGKALPRAFIAALRAGETPAHKEFANAERRMDALADRVALWLEEAGYASLAKLKTGLLPHKTVALRAGLGFIGKNNLLITPEYGCALALGKVLTTAPFSTSCVPPQAPRCGECRICVDACPTQALLNKTWSVTTTREEILTRKLCCLCLKCMVNCPYTAAYCEGNEAERQG